MNEANPLISVVIPVKNGATWLAETIPAILEQTLASSTEIIAIDSGSTDNTLDILSRYPVKVLSIEPGSFNHGTVRNLGAIEGKGKYIVMTVQDAKPADDKWLQELLNGFELDDKVAGVCGLQIVPHDLDKNPIDWFRPISAPKKRKYYFERPENFDALSPEEKKNICSWDDVNAMYKKDVLLKVPFRKVSFAEDALWARDALLQGYSIVYNPAAKVTHYHFETPDYAFRRSFTVHYHFYKFFGLKPVVPRNEFVNILRNFKLLLPENKISWKSKWKWLLFNFRQRRAVKRSIMTFYEVLANGEEALDIKHQEISGIPPQALNPGLSGAPPAYSRQ